MASSLLDYDVLATMTGVIGGVLGPPSTMPVGEEFIGIGRAMQVQI